VTIEIEVKAGLFMQQESAPSFPTWEFQYHQQEHEMNGKKGKPFSAQSKGVHQ
jgi:hypothetical protein